MTILLLQERYRASERKVRRLVGKCRSTQRHSPKIVSIEAVKLGRRLRNTPAEHARLSRRIVHRLLRREGLMVNHKRVHRL